jgi:hypothetical protein
MAILTDHMDQNTIQYTIHIHMKYVYIIPQVYTKYAKKHTIILTTNTLNKNDSTKKTENYGYYK